MSKDYVKQLTDRDPEKRKAAIHRVAHNLDRNALHRLALMTTNDPDEEIRTLARRAGVYIREKLGELPPGDPPANGKGEKSDKPGKPATIPVKPEDMDRAKAYMNSAVQSQISGANSKAIKSLAQAMKIDPNLRHDAYFINLAQSVTGVDGPGAVDQLGNAVSLSKDHLERESRQKLQKQVDEHQTRIQKATATDLALDFGVLAIVLLIGFTVLLALNIEVAKAFVTKVEQNWEAVALAQAEGRIVDREAETLVYLTTELDSANKPRQFQELVPDEQIWSIATQFKATALTDLLLPVFGMMVGVMVLLLVGIGIGHLLATRMLRGVGRLPYFGHLLITTLSTRLVTVLIALGAGSIVIYELNSGIFLAILAGVIGLIALLAIFKLLKLAGEAYHFGIGQGLLVLLPTLLLLGGGAAAVVLL